MCTKRNPAIVFSPELLLASEKNPKFKRRERLVYGLIAAFGLTRKMVVLPPRVATKAELQSYHSPVYLSFLEGHNDCQDHEDIEDSSLMELEQLGLGYDCPVFHGMFDYCCSIVGSSVTAAEAIASGGHSVVINWFGGWHHGKRSGASGFCYCNDIVVAILKLLSRFKLVLYVDLDLHHGNGVEEAFYYTEKVMVVSFHKYHPGFYPGSGKLEDVGKGRGMYFTVNVPLKDGIGDKQYVDVFTRVLSLVRSACAPDVVVLQCGADTLVGDPMDSFSLTARAVGECVQQVLGWDLPTLILGGGGYSFPSTARCWTHITGVVVGETLDNDIPEHEYSAEYGPEFILHPEPPELLKKNCNTQEDLDAIVESVRGAMLNIQQHESQI